MDLDEKAAEDKERRKTIKRNLRTKQKTKLRTMSTKIHLRLLRAGAPNIGHMRRSNRARLGAVRSVLCASCGHLEEDQGKVFMVSAKHFRRYLRRKA